MCRGTYLGFGSFPIGSPRVPDRLLASGRGKTMNAPLTGPAASLKLKTNQLKSEPLENMSASLIQPFQVVILYDNASSGVRAMRTYESFCRELGVDYAFEVKLWRLDMLPLVDQTQVAMPRLEHADMVIVACGADYENLFLLDDWAARWPRAHDDAKRVLVALYTGPAEARGTNSYERWLSALGSLAARVKLDFITPPVEKPGRDTWVNFAASAAPVLPPRAARLDVIAIPPHLGVAALGYETRALATLAPGTPRWGINE